MSSPTVMFVLEVVVRSGDPQPGDWGVMIALGPGMAAEALGTVNASLKEENGHRCLTCRFAASASQRYHRIVQSSLPPKYAGQSCPRFPSDAKLQFACDRP